jgi:FKBP-type peptidyl-prolyl cis-trans isomerase
MALLALSAFSLTFNSYAADPAKFLSLKDKASYALGMNIGKQLRVNGAQINVDLYAEAVKAALANSALELTEEEARAALDEYREEIRKNVEEQNLLDGAKFLAENKKKPGVKETASGLQYKVITEGTGKIPTTNDTVLCHYRGILIDGQEFDSSYKRGQPSSFPVTRVIKGWTEALLMMPVGSKWQLGIPAELAYGVSGGRGIPPNSALLFDIELVEIKDPNAAPPTPRANPVRGQPTVSKPVRVPPKKN